MYVYMHLYMCTYLYSYWSKLLLHCNYLWASLFSEDRKTQVASNCSVSKLCWNCDASDKLAQTSWVPKITSWESLLWLTALHNDFTVWIVATELLESWEAERGVMQMSRRFKAIFLAFWCWLCSIGVRMFLFLDKSFGEVV